LWAVLEETQRGQDALGRVRTLEPSIGHRDRMATQSQPGGSNAARRILECVVGHESVFVIRMVQKIAERPALKLKDVVG
jgi:hypothetical protein